MFLLQMHLGLNKGGLFSHEMRQMKGKGGFGRNNKLQHKGECGKHLGRMHANRPTSIPHMTGVVSTCKSFLPFKHIRFNITLVILPTTTPNNFTNSTAIQWIVWRSTQILSSKIAHISNFISVTENVISDNSYPLRKINMIKYVV